jgi:hypothetical protein
MEDYAVTPARPSPTPKASIHYGAKLLECSFERCKWEAQPP